MYNGLEIGFGGNVDVGFSLFLSVCSGASFPPSLRFSCAFFLYPIDMLPYA